MRPVDRRVKRKQTSKVTSLPSPIGGWNARDSLAEMQPTDAVILDNWFPRASDVVMRSGYTNHVTGLPGTVNTLMTYSSSTAQQMFAAAGTGIYNVTTSGTAGAPVIAITSSKLQYTNFRTPGGAYLTAVNGADKPLLYDGTSWRNYSTASPVTLTSLNSSGTAASAVTSTPHGLATGDSITISGATPAAYNGVYNVAVTGATGFNFTTLTAPGGAATVVGSYVVNFSLTGVDPRLFINVGIWKTRMFFVEKNSLRVWYLGVGAVGGAASSIDFGPIFRQGGKIVTVFTWTIDGGYGVDDNLCVMTDQGQVAVYRGTDPSTASNFSLIGVFDLGAPVGQRPCVKYAGDEVLITLDGFVPLSKALVSTRINNQIAVSDKISGAVTEATTAYQFNYGWQGILFPKENMLIFNVPLDSVTSHQYIMNTITGAWCRFKGWNAACFELFGDNLYFGTAGKVCRAYNNTSDAGSNIQTDVQQAFSYFGAPGRKKQFKMVQPIFMANQPPALSLKMNVDFDDLGIFSVATPLNSNAALWDVARWDQAVWAGVQIYKNWQSVNGIGVAGALRMRIDGASLQNSWASTNYVYEYAGVL